MLMVARLLIHTKSFHREMIYKNCIITEHASYYQRMVISHQSGHLSKNIYLQLMTISHQSGHLSKNIYLQLMTISHQSGHLSKNIYLQLMTIFHQSGHLSKKHIFPWHINVQSTLCPLQWRHNERNCVANLRRLHCLLNRLFRRRSKTTSKLRVTGLCEGNSPVTGEFPSQRASNAENSSIWWRHHACLLTASYM